MNLATLYLPLSTDHAKAPYLDDLVARMFHGVVRVIHLPRRSGLITARLAGAKEATSDVLMFIDSHCEASVNYLPPLLGTSRAVAVGMIGRGLALTFGSGLV